MALGPGTYDKETTEIREKVKADGVVLLIINGDRGMGFEVQATGVVLAHLPHLLRLAADDMEKDFLKFNKLN